MGKNIKWISSMIGVIVTILGIVSVFKPDLFIIHDETPVFAEKIDSTDDVHKFWDFSEKHQFQKIYLHLIIPIQSGLVSVPEKDKYFNNIILAGTAGCRDQVRRGEFWCSDGRITPEGYDTNNWYSHTFNPRNKGVPTMRLTEDSVELSGYFSPRGHVEEIKNAVSWDFDEIQVNDIPRPLTDKEKRDIINKLK